ncbi:TRAP dicarboxylate transporter subunit DctP [Gloeomargarita lithophora Alchichica-D10]|uniref:TRAP dicarboxylate transporter subunit DctP n=1 Tax=Gloeomargarita lithophora Alchichica-D10 TaxID=1188229 RepID=A0A1J0ACR6_9CYAN|nr:ABC transporter substrate-binding protein [Gloeomargarita lithophora]APB33713.1 TRAP dicarboxylate transporter subunit DctP [Gloeomargarita lithophora Alchichica-D10]
MRRRFGLAGFGVLTVTACSRKQAPAVITQPRVRWRLVTSWPASLDTLFGGVRTLAAQVKQLTDGRFTLTPFAAGEIVPGLQVLDAVRSGTVEAGHTASYYYLGQNPALAFGTGVPFGLTPQQQNAWWYAGGGLAAMQSLYQDFGVITFPAGNTGAQMGGWFRREVPRLSDLKGLKMRLPGLGGKVMAQMGVNVQVLPGSELFLALERGALDAAEWVGPYDDLRLGLPRAARYYYYPGWWEPGPSVELLINLRAWEQLPLSYQKALELAAQASNLALLSQYEGRNQTALQQLKTGGTQLRPYGDDILKTAWQVTQDLLADQSRRSSAFQKIYQPWRQFQKESLTWEKTGSLSTIMGFAQP